MPYNISHVIWDLHRVIIVKLSCYGNSPEKLHFKNVPANNDSLVQKSCYAAVMQ